MAIWVAVSWCQTRWQDHLVTLPHNPKVLVYKPKILKITLELSSPTSILFPLECIEISSVDVSAVSMLKQFFIDPRGDSARDQVFRVHFYQCAEFYAPLPDFHDKKSRFSRNLKLVGLLLVSLVGGLKDVWFECCDDVWMVGPSFVYLFWPVIIRL